MQNENNEDTKDQEIGKFFTTDKGTFYSSADGAVFVSSPLKVIATTHDEKDGSYGRLLEFTTTYGKTKRWAMPAELLEDMTALRRELRIQGVEIPAWNKFTKELFAKYMQQPAPRDFMICVHQLGWCAGNRYVLPDAVVGNDADKVVLQTASRAVDGYAMAGTLDGWREGVGAKARFNDVLMLCIASQFAGPLLKLVNSEGGGVHIYGGSSRGKSTCADAACSVWGKGTEHRKSWNTTTVGLEMAAVQYNDNTITLDEINEADPKHIGNIIYAIGNGVGRMRGAKSGGAAPLMRWNCFAVSTGEKKIKQYIQEQSKSEHMAGMETRMLEICADGYRYNVLDDLHGAKDGEAFGEQLRGAWAKHHGVAGREYLQHLTLDGRNWAEEWRKYKDYHEFNRPTISGQERRAAGRFALIAMAGELATDYGLTDWDAGMATDCAGRMFDRWLEGRDGEGDSEQHKAKNAILSFINLHGDTRFSDESLKFQTAVHDRAGWWSEGFSGDREYWFHVDGLKAALRGIDYKRAKEALINCGLMRTFTRTKDGKEVVEDQRAVKISGATKRVHVIDINAMDRQAKEGVE